MKTQQIIAGVLVAIVLAVATYGATRPDAGLLKFQIKDSVAYGYGGTSSRSYGAVKDMMREHPEVETIVLKKMPGTKDGHTNLGIARDIRKRGLSTHLDKNSFIASGAVDLFLAGAKRTMECGALIGVHSWSYGGKMYPANMGSDPEQKQHERFLSDMGINPDFYVFTREAALPHEMYYLSVDDINRFELLSEPLDCDD